MSRVEQPINPVYFYSEIFIRLVCAIFLFAFIDTFIQYNYLIGENGCAPVTGFLENAKVVYGNMAVFRFPGIFWFSSSDSFIGGTLLVASLAALLGIMGICVSLNLFIAFISWLSFINSGSDFFIYIWDTFLLEAGFIAMLISLFNRNEKYNRLLTFLLWIFTFRLWFSMGMVTVLYNDSVAFNGNFIKLFFQNQPMPTTVSFFMYHLPGWIHTCMSFVVIIIENIFPFLIFFRRWRAFAAFCFLGLSIVIELCGNFAWFNILTAALCFPLLIDTKTGEKLLHFFSSLPLKRFGFRFDIALKPILAIVYLQLFLQLLLVVFLFFPAGNRYLNFLNYYDRGEAFQKWEKQSVANSVLAFPLHLGSSFKIANPYGVFKGIPVKRWELVFEVLTDTTKAPVTQVIYHYKPGLSNGCSFYAPHFPRLEQQLFYEAQQGSFYRVYTPYEYRLPSKCWTTGLIRRLKKDADYKKNSSPITPDRYAFIKVKVVELTFNSKEVYAKTGEIWASKEVAAYNLSAKDAGCPLVPDVYFKRFKKHVP